MEFTVQRHRLTERPRPHHRTLPCPTPHYLITKGLFIAVCLLGASCPALRKKKKKMTSPLNLKRQKKHENQTLEEMLKLSDQEFKITLITRLRDVMYKLDSIQDQMNKASREVEILRKYIGYISFYFPEPWNLKRR